jgi:hypothetical protein
VYQDWQKAQYVARTGYRLGRGLLEGGTAMVKKLIEDVTDEEIEKEFRGTNFGGANHREILSLSVLKKALGYHCGWTVTNIMLRMGLTKEDGTLTDRGKLFCYDAFDLKRSG